MHVIFVVPYYFRVQTYRAISCKNRYRFRLSQFKN